MASKPKKKPRLASGRKRARQTVKLNPANTSLRSQSTVPPASRTSKKAVLAGDKTKATELFAKAQSVLDTIADKGIFHKNKATPRQEPPVRQGQGPGTGCLTLSNIARATSVACVCNGCAVSKAKTAPGRFFVRSDLRCVGQQASFYHLKLVVLGEIDDEIQAMGSWACRSRCTTT